LTSSSGKGRMSEENRWRDDIKLFVGTPGVRLHLVGIGNPVRKDDAVGLEVASSLRRLLRGNRPKWLRVHGPSPQPEMLLPKIPLGERILIFDAVEANKKPGAVVCAPLRDTRYGFFATHNIPLRLLPGMTGRGDDVLLVGVQPASVEVGEGLTPPIKKSADSLAEEVARVVRSSHG
jgi:hydrogenase 3 maturation protease